MNSQTIQLGQSPKTSHPIDDIFSSIVRRVETGLIVALDTVLEFLQNQRERDTLMHLNDRELSDIGLSRSIVGNADEGRDTAN